MSHSGRTRPSHCEWSSHLHDLRFVIARLMQYQSLYNSGFPCGSPDLDKSFQQRASPPSTTMVRRFLGHTPTRVPHRATHSDADSKLEDPFTRVLQTKASSSWTCFLLPKRFVFGSLDHKQA